MFTNITRAYRVSIPDQANTVVIPNDISYATIRNAGIVAIKINFGDDSANNFYTLTVGSDPITLFVGGGKTINTDGVGGPSTLEIVVWG